MSRCLRGGKTCPTCMGERGYYQLPDGERFFGDWMTDENLRRYAQFWTDCPDCEGTGRIPPSEPYMAMEAQTHRRGLRQARLETG